MSRTKAAMYAAQSAVNCYLSDFKQDPSDSIIYSQYDNAWVKVESARVIDLSLSVSEGYNDSIAPDSTSTEGTDDIEADLLLRWCRKPESARLPFPSKATTRDEKP